MQRPARLFAIAGLATALAACGAAPDAGRAPPDLGRAVAADGGGLVDGDAAAAPPDASPPPDTLAANRDRLLASYLDFLRASPTTVQSNGLAGGQLAGVCDLWTRLDPSSQAVFLTLTARLQGATLAADGSSMLGHVTRLYRVAGGQGAAGSAAGSCGGGEYNRMMMSMDAALQQALRAANLDRGQAGANGKPDIADIPVGNDAVWRDSHDAAGPHAPFDLSDETEAGAPRGQVQYFRDPTSAAAEAALGRLDLETLIDPYALEMDQDYDCVHNSNPLCDYVTYGPLCAPEPSLRGLDLYQQRYGSVVPAWQPAGCAAGH